MGTRIHRALGWKTTHPHPEKISEILEDDDPNALTAFLDREIGTAKVASRSSDAMWLTYERRFAQAAEGRATVKFGDVAKNTNHGYGGMSNWIVMPPAFALKWHRRDDDLDYHATRWLPDWQTPPLVELAQSPYPYEEQSKAHGSGVPIVIRLLARELGLDERALRPVLETWWA